MLVVFLSGCSTITKVKDIVNELDKKEETTPESQIKLLPKTDKHDETVSEVFEFEGKVYKRVGTSEIGYITVPDEFYRFRDLNASGPNVLQYSKDGFNTVTLTKIDLSVLNAEEKAAYTTETAIVNMIKYLESIDGKFIEGGEVETEDYDNALYATAEVNNVRITLITFNPKGNKEDFYMLSIEGSEEFIEENNIIFYTWDFY